MSASLHYQVRKRSLTLIKLASLIIVVASIQPAAAATTFQNPLNTSDGSDPWLLTYNGQYYLTTTTWTDIRIKHATSINGLISASSEQVWQDTDPARCCNMWAPEIHLLSGPDGTHWYIYYVAGHAANINDQRIWVLESTSTDPMGPYTFKSQLTDSLDGWMIDPTVGTINGQLYAFFSAFSGSNQSLWIAPMSNPWTISDSRALISTPTFDWERQLAPVNEGPELLQNAGKTYLIYSASACWGPGYALGQLSLTGSDPMNGKSWTKKSTPIFSSANGSYGPAHNGFFVSKDGKENWLVYHASDSPNVTCNGNRTTRIQKFTFYADGSPNLGSPLSLSTALAVPSGD